MVSDGFDMEIHIIASLFYMDCGLITSTCPYWIQWAVDILTDIFEWVGMWENDGNTVGLVFQICHIFFQELQHSVWAMDDGVGGNLLVPPVTIRPVPVLSGRHCGRVAGDTSKDTELCQTWPPLVTPTPPQNKYPKMYCVYFPKDSSPLACSLEGFHVRAVRQTNIYVHFMH